MKNSFFIILLNLFTINCFSQNKTLFIVDSIPLINRNIKISSILEEEEIFKAEVSTDRNLLNTYEFKVDTILFITTKAYSMRDEATRRIPSTTRMVRKNDLNYYYDNVIYTGPYIDYHYNGKIKSKGQMLDGKINGINYSYHDNGTIKYKSSSKLGHLNGLELRYYKNGNIKEKGHFVNNFKVGKWETFHEDGYLIKTVEYSSKKKAATKLFYSTGKIKKEFTSNYSWFPNSEYQKLYIQFFVLEKHGEIINYAYWHDENEFIKTRRFKKINKKIDKLISENKNFDTYYIFKAFLLYITKDYDNALKNYQTALLLEPKNDFVKDRIIITHIRKAETKSASLPKSIMGEICEKIKLGEDQIVSNFEVINLKHFAGNCPE